MSADNTTASGNLTVTGLPFTSSATYYHTGTMQFNGITKATFTDFVARIGPSTASVIFIASGSGIQNAAVTAADVPSAGTVVVMSTIVYTIP